MIRLHEVLYQEYGAPGMSYSPVFLRMQGQG